MRLGICLASTVIDSYSRPSTLAAYSELCLDIDARFLQVFSIKRRTLELNEQT